MELADLVEEAPAGMMPFQPSQRYLLIDQKRLGRIALKANGNVLALLFRFELSSAPEVLREIAPALVTWLSATSQLGLRQSVATWLNRVAERRSGQAASFSLEKTEEFTDMGRKFATWAEEFEYIGFKKGRAEGKLTERREILEQLLHSRFGELPSQVTERINSATRTQLKKWFDRILTAPTVTAVFGQDNTTTHKRPD